MYLYYIYIYTLYTNLPVKYVCIYIQDFVFILTLKLCSDERQNSFKPLKKACSLSQQKRFKCFRQFEKMHSGKTVKQKRKLFRQRIEAVTRGVL